ncbi:hypothetical protein AVEN_163258-1, partial [Araneus ventricosus]
MNSFQKRPLDDCGNAFRAADDEDDTGEGIFPFPNSCHTK